MAARSPAAWSSPAAKAGLLYGAAVNAAAAAAFAYDKQCAIEGKWRVSENTLCVTALLGGWIGGMWAMQHFRHKTAKKSFQEKYYTAVAANVGTVAAVATPGGRGMLLRTLGQLAARQPAAARKAPRMRRR